MHNSCFCDLTFFLEFITHDLIVQAQNTTHIPQLPREGQARRALLAQWLDPVPRLRRRPGGLRLAGCVAWPSHNGRWDMKGFVSVIPADDPSHTSRHTFVQAKSWPTCTGWGSVARVGNGVRRTGYKGHKMYIGHGNRCTLASTLTFHMQMKPSRFSETMRVGERRGLQVT